MMSRSNIWSSSKVHYVDICQDGHIYVLIRKWYKLWNIYLRNGRRIRSPWNVATSEGPASKTVWCMKWFFMLFPKTTQFTFQTTTVTDTVFELSVMFRCIHWPPVFIQKSQRKAARWNTSLPLIKLLPWVWTLLKTFGIMSTRLVKLFFKAFYCGNVCNCFISVSLFQFLHLLSFNIDNLVFSLPPGFLPQCVFPRI